ncbi:MAG: DUF3783 domain-containing protein [Peptococcaceae bacterium]|nr:DUF3783 domain-containing protein [Peptococcaceae bacterium]
MLYIYQLETLSPADQTAFIEAADRCGEAVSELTNKDLHKTVAECLKAPVAIEMRDFQPRPQMEGEPFLLMDVDDLAIDTFLAAMRERKVRIGHKCMITAKNKGWHLSKLIGDVQEEHALMSALIKLQRSLDVAKGFNEADYAPLMWQAFDAQRKQAADLLAHVGKVEIAKETVESVTNQLNVAVMSMLQMRGGKR